jgi:DNA polymerase-1
MSENQILVTQGNLSDVLRELLPEKSLAVDTETTGLEAFKSNELFSIIVSSKSKDYYFNWYAELGVAEYHLQDKALLKPLFDTPRLWILQNAKFDLHFLAKAGLFPAGEYYDTQVAGRVLYNLHDSYSLDAMSERELGERKDDAVMKWLEDNKCFSMVPVPGRKKMAKNYHFEQVPFEIISRYGWKDGRLTYRLWEKQMADFLETDMPVANTEMRLIETLYDMENQGVQVDTDFCARASVFEHKRIQAYLGEWLALVGTDLVDSGEYLKPVFEGYGFSVGWTDKMEPAVDQYAIAEIDHESARILDRYRDAEKRYTTFMGILSAMDSRGVVHTNFKQAGTVTGRMSSFSPNLQNLSSDDAGEFPVRRAFVPRPGFFFVSIDYKQMEFRLLLDYANEQELIGKIMQGHDPHDATAETTGLTRKAAKTLNFGLVYGMGIRKLGKAIGVDDAEAKAFKARYFAALPGVKQFLWNAAKRQELRGFTWNWYGRRFALKERKFSYRAPNSIIQGGCADVCKIAMNALHGFLKPYATKMVLQVHDEILFEVALEEAHLVGVFQETMEKAYPFKNIPLTCSVSYSLKSFQDMTEVESWGEILDALGKSVPNASAKAAQGTTEPVVLQGQ